MKKLFSSSLIIICLQAARAEVIQFISAEYVTSQSSFVSILDSVYHASEYREVVGKKVYSGVGCYGSVFPPTQTLGQGTSSHEAVFKYKVRWIPTGPTNLPDPEKVYPVVFSQASKVKQRVELSAGDQEEVSYNVHGEAQAGGIPNPIGTYPAAAATIMTPQGFAVDEYSFPATAYFQGTVLNTANDWVSAGTWTTGVNFAFVNSQWIGEFTVTHLSLASGILSGFFAPELDPGFSTVAEHCGRSILETVNNKPVSGG